MELTGKCKEDFKVYLLKKYPNNDSSMSEFIELPIGYERFIEIHPDDIFNLPIEFLFGVYVDFFDSVGLEIQIYVGEFGGWCIVIYNEKAEKYFSLKDNLENDWLGSTRQEAREKAIEKANEIYNNK